MKKATYDFLVRIPIIGKVIDALIDPIISSRQAHRAIYNYVKENPDEKVTKAVLKKILRDSKYRDG